AAPRRRGRGLPRCPRLRNPVHVRAAADGLRACGGDREIVQRTLRELELEAVCWNVVPTHPGTASSNRRPTRAEVAAGRPFLEEIASGRRIVAVGRLAAEATGAAYLRHPSHGGAAEFRAGLLRFAAGGRL